MKRLWLLTPPVVLYLFDIGLTLAGQPSDYWSGDFGSAVEANPIAYQLLTLGPWLFIGLAVMWLVLISFVVLLWQHPVTGWFAAIITALHALGGASWLTRTGSWGLVVAAAYIAVAAQASRWSWRRFAQAT